jgi:hypothetical protein
MPAGIHIFGIRHHGPGSARCLVEALDALQPLCVLIEGPADLSDLLGHLAAPEMTPPVALLAYDVNTPERASFWPFAEYSPEYQAAKWALARGISPRFIDIPAAWRLAETPAASSESATPAEDPTDDASVPASAEFDPVAHDPLGTLAAAAGYEDGESWWRDVIEENPEPGPVFAAVAEAMTALRTDDGGQALPCRDPHEARREAHMRLEIAAAAKDTDGPVAVICGAWHAPALAAKHAARADRELIRGAGKAKTVATWAPWTSPRLASASGYGAGVTAPKWCEHLWRTPQADVETRWIVRIAATLREKGHTASTASLIETQRLARALAALRGRPAAGFEEIREATIACLCDGEPLRWALIEPILLVGSDVGTVPDNVPLAPLLEDLKRQQKAVRLKPEALDRELSLDLRTEAGLARSVLLHRLGVLGVGWGRITDAGRSRGTFRERWVVAWQPEFAVNLVENLVHGPTIELAAAGRLAGQIAAAGALPEIAGLTLHALTAELPVAASTGIERLSRRAVETSDCGELLATLPPLVDVARYGNARGTDTSAMAQLIERIVVGATLALPYAARGLDREAASGLAQRLRDADAALVLAEPDAGLLRNWREAQLDVVRDTLASQLLAGLAARLLYEAENANSEEIADLFGRRLSPGVQVADAAAFFEGFFLTGCDRLIFDGTLRDAVSGWMGSLDEDAFVEHLPLFRRVFSILDRQERRRLLEAATGQRRATGDGLQLIPDAAAIWARHEPIIQALFDRDPPP